MDQTTEALSAIRDYLRAAYTLGDDSRAMFGIAELAGRIDALTGGYGVRIDTFSASVRTETAKLAPPLVVDATLDDEHQPEAAS